VWSVRTVYIDVLTEWWSGRLSLGVRTRVVIIVRTCATSLLLFEAASVRTSTTHRLDGDPTEAIKNPAHRIITLPHKISLLAGCEFPLFVSFWQKIKH
jgi:hypothetical protein